MPRRDGPPLAALQERFYRLVTAPISVARALPDAGLDRDDVDAWFLGDDRLDAIERLDLYANMYFFRIHDVLADLFPRLVALVGDRPFHNLVTDYLAACPPVDPSIARAGARLPGFLAGHALGRERPWLADLAAVEWITADLHEGPDAVPLDLDTLRAVAPADLGDLRLGLVPCHARVASTHAIDRLLGDDTADPPPAPTTVAVWRPALEVRRRALTALEAAIFEDLARGMTVAELCEAVAARVGEDDAVAATFEHLGRWVAEGHLIAT